MATKWGPIGQQVFERTYSRTKEDGSKESFDEVVERMVDGNLALAPDHVDGGERETLIKLISEHKLVPAGRHWWVSGVPGRQFLFNCVAGETLVMTPDGDKPIEELAGLEESIPSYVELYVHNMYARPTVAPVQWYGRRNVVSVRLKSGGMEQIIRATPDHDWIKQDGTRVTTAELKPGDKLATTSTRNRFSTTTMSNIGVMAGFVYGDGSRTDQSARVRLCGEKDAEMLPWFTGCDVQRFRSTGSDPIVMGLPRSWKDAPSLDEGACYLKGWLAGYIAADGHVSEAGYVTIGSRSKESLELARKVATFLGIRTSTIRIHENSPGFNGPQLAFNVRLERVSDDMLLLSHHRELYVEHLFDDWRVMSITDKDEVTDVYCAYVENLHEFTLAGWLRTGNCHRAGWTDQLSDHVGFLFDELMKGGGVGANYSHDYMERMHRVRRRIYVSAAGTGLDENELDEFSPETEVLTSFHVEDSREGWAAALEHLCRMAQLEGPDLEIQFDMLDVREAGAPIKGFGGTASGPRPLAQMLVSIAQILRRAVGRRITGLEAMEIDHEIARCVVAGNVRRSARMSMMHWEDPDIFKFIDLKADGGHWTTNISVEVDDRFWRAIDAKDRHATTVLHLIARGMHRNAEPGIYNSSRGARGERGDVRCTNPCGEIALEEWEQCNLGHVNLAKVEDMHEFSLCASLMARWLLRATMAKGSSWRQWEVVQRNRRIGVGILGFQEWLWKEFQCDYRSAGTSPAIAEYFQAVYYDVLREVDRYTRELGINSPIKLTTVAPTGTTAKISGVTEGIHPVYSRYFIRRVRFADTDSYLTDVADNTVHIEPDLNNPNTKVVSYVCRDAAMDVVPPHKLVQSNELSPEEMLRVQLMVQRGWADNAVSFTVNFNPKRWGVDYVERCLNRYGRELKGTTFMPEGSYQQAPLERITKDEYEAAASKFVGSSADECAGGACPIK